MNQYRLSLEVYENREIDEIIEANSYDEALDIAIKKYGIEKWCTCCGNIELIKKNKKNTINSKILD